MTEEQRKSVIKEVRPILGPEGNQRFYKDKHGSTNYDFWITFENGDEGKASGRTEGKFRFEPGEEVLYTKAVYDDKPDAKPFILIKKISKPFTKTTSSTSYNDPINNKRMAMGVAQQATIEMLEILKVEPTMDMIKNITTAFFKWITFKDNNRDILSARWYSLIEAVKTIGLGIEHENNFVNEMYKELKSWTNVAIKIADVYYEQRNSIY